jgi:hypothetical protein
MGIGCSKAPRTKSDHQPRIHQRDERELLIRAAESRHKSKSKDPVRDRKKIRLAQALDDIDMRQKEISGLRYKQQAKNNNRLETNV